MSDTLFGRERSGTPIETRGATSDLAQLFQQLIQGQMGSAGFAGGAVPFGRLQADAAAATAPLFAAMAPFEQRAREDTAALTREQFGTLGGRFGSGVQQAESRALGELAGQQQLVREQSLLETLLGLGGLQQQQLATMAGFLQPGAPVFQPGIAGDLLTAGGLAAGSFLNPAGAASGFLGRAAGGRGGTPGFLQQGLFEGVQPGMRR